jgi:hypothetical protein
MANHINQPVPSPLPASFTAAGNTNINGVIFPSASRAAATYDSDVMYNPGAKGVRLFIAISDPGAAGTVTVSIQVKDPVTDAFVTITGATSTALAAAATTTLTVFPGITVSANVDLSNHVGPEWRVRAVVAANAVVFSIGADYLL